MGVKAAMREDQQRLDKATEQKRKEAAVEEARLKKLEELRRWREEEIEREKQAELDEIERQKREAEEKVRKEMEDRIRAEAKRKKKLQREEMEREEQEEKDEWERMKEEARKAESNKPQAPPWAVLGAKCFWKSQSTANSKPLPVTITGTDAQTGDVTVVFDKDPSAYKVVPVDFIGGSGPLQQTK